MSVLPWALANMKIAGLLTGSVGVLAIGTSVFVEKDSGEYLLRYVPDTHADLYKTPSMSWSQTMDGKEWDELPIVKRSYRSLIEGDTNYNSGNYLIYYGSEACPHCTGFMFGDHSLAKGNLSVHRDKASNGQWMRTFDAVKKDEVLKHIGIKFLMFEDIPETNGDDKKWTLPWSTDKITNEYIRNDQSAIDFRKVIDASQNKFKEKAPGTPTVIVYKKGKPKVFNQEQLPGLTLEKQGEALDKDNDLYKYIKHYYTQDI